MWGLPKPDAPPSSSCPFYNHEIDSCRRQFSCSSGTNGHFNFLYTPSGISERFTNVSTIQIRVAFQNFITTGVGAKPIIVGYENQLVEFSVENDREILKVVGIPRDVTAVIPMPSAEVMEKIIASLKSA